MSKQDRQFCLVLKRKNNDFLPIEWNLLKFYHGEDLYSLEGIDNFTSKITRKELLEELLESNFVKPTDEFAGFSIIFKVKNRTRELKEGTIFKEDNAVLSEDQFIDFLVMIYMNKELLNEVFNVCHFKDVEEKVDEFKFVLKNIDMFSLKGINGVKGAFSIFKSISYEKKRTIILRVVDTVIPRLDKKYKFDN